MLGWGGGGGEVGGGAGWGLDVDLIVSVPEHTYLLENIA